MTVLIATNTNGKLHYLAGRYPGRVGWMMSPATRFQEPRQWLPYAIDNGRFNPKAWEEPRFFDLLDRCRMARYKPLWVAVPDELGDAQRTREMWFDYEPRLRRYGWPLAFVAQDGQELADVPRSADLIFIGGTTEWKWRYAATFAACYPRIHVGRVHAIDKIEYCQRLGVESTDGSGFFRGGEDNIKVTRLEEFLEGRRRYEEQHRLELA
jgi:hypothetical protein